MRNLLEFETAWQIYNIDAKADLKFIIIFLSLKNLVTEVCSMAKITCDNGDVSRFSVERFVKFFDIYTSF